MAKKASNRTVVLNLAQVRADKAATAPVIVGPDGREYPVGGIPLDGFLAILELQQAFSQGDAANLPAIIPGVKALVEDLLPGFPVGSLTIDELMAVIGAMQMAVGPEPVAGAEGGSDDAAGE